MNAEAVERSCVLASRTNCPLYVDTVKSKSVSNIIAEKRQQGCIIFEKPISALFCIPENASHWDQCSRSVGERSSYSAALSSDTTSGLQDLFYQYFAGMSTTVAKIYNVYPQKVNKYNTIYSNYHI